MIFGRQFIHPIESANSYLKDDTFLASQDPDRRVNFTQEISFVLVRDLPNSFNDCIIWARHLFDELFEQDIHQLLKKLPLDLRTATGELFWEAPHRKTPTAIGFSAENVCRCCRPV